MKDIYNPGSPFRLTSPYGDRSDPNKAGSREFHAGLDYAAPAGTPIPAATSGVVVYSGKNAGFGNTVVVRNDTGDYSLYAHMQDGDRAKVGQQVWPGDTLGQVGSTGQLARGNHLHYSIISASAGKAIENPSLPHDGGPIGIRVNKASTIDPAQYDPQPYLEEFRRAEHVMSAGNASAAPVASPPPGDPFYSPFAQAPPGPSNSPNPFADRFGKWGSVPLPNAPAASDDPANFADRFGKWDLGAPGALGNVGAPAPQVTPHPAKRSEADDSAPLRVLSRVNLSPVPVPSEAPPLAPASASPLLGIFSGQPMRDYPAPPPIFQPKYQASPEDSELFQRWMRWVDA